MVGDIRKYVQHISLSPDSIQNDEVSAWLSEGSAWRGLCVVGPRRSLVLKTLLAGRGPTHEVSG